MMATEKNVLNSAGQYAKVNGILMYYQACGSGRPLILLHGGGEVSGAWAPHIQILSKHFRVIAPDSRGHGLTENTIHPLSYRLLADDLSALIQELGLIKPILCGWSDGANIALDLGMRYPDLAGGLILNGLFTRISEQYREALKSFWVLAPGVVDFERLEQDAPAIVQDLQQKHSSLYGPDYWKTLFIDLSVLFLTPPGYTKADYIMVQVPTLIVSGDRDEFLPVEEHVETYRLIPGAELEIILGATHWLPVTHVEIFVDAILAFVNRHWKE
jgi:pimeloyl-ACP methyl ester carboxylesterase